MDDKISYIITHGQLFTLGKILNISELNDVELINLSDNQALVWNDDINKFINISTEEGN